MLLRDVNRIGSHRPGLALKCGDGLHDTKARGIDPLVWDPAEGVQPIGEPRAVHHERIELALGLRRGVGTESLEDWIKLANGTAGGRLKGGSGECHIEPGAVDC